MSTSENQHYPYEVTVEQKSEILGMGIALQGLADDDSQYDEGYLADIMEHITRLTQQLDFDTYDQLNVTQGFIIDHQGEYKYANYEPLIDHIPDVMSAYQRLTNLTLKK